jgi:predicted DNA-binding transcriptional regulator AlpA
VSRGIEDYHPEDLVGTAEIAALAGCCRAHATNTVVKRLGFPRPVIDLSQKTRRWLKSDVLKYLGKRRPTPQPPPPAAAAPC